MFGEGAMWDDYGNNNEDKNKEEMPEKLVVDVDIPLIKSEPMSPTRSTSYESLEGGILTSHLPIVTPCKLKEPIIFLERCDKIWETLKLIKTVQSNDLDSDSDDEEPTEQMDTEQMDTEQMDTEQINTEQINTEQMDTENSTTVSSEKDANSYIRYQPVLGNGALPNFQLSVKSTKKLFHCNVCGKEYSENRSLRAHSQKIHGIFIPPKRRVKPNPNSSYNLEMMTRSALKDRKSPINDTKNTMENNVFTKEPTESGGENKKFDVIFQPTSIKTNKNNPQLEEKNNTLAKNTVYIKSRSRPKCPLCKRIVSNLSKHLTEYHKINCPNLIMREIESTVQSQTEITLKDLTKAIVTSSEKASKQVDENTLQNLKNDKRKLEETYSPPEKKLKLSNNDTLNVANAAHNVLRQKHSENNSFKCDICLGVYASYNSYYKHTRIHRRRGETKDNFDGLHCRYLNSPLNGKRLASLTPDNASTVVAPNKRKRGKANRISLDSMDSANSQDYESGTYNGNGINKIPRRKTRSENLDRSCICGRMFRDYHTLVLHKRGCKIRDTIETESDDNLDKDSGNGINITIKKKNDSYEIVSRDSGDENKSKDSGHPNDCDTPSDISDFTSDDYNEMVSENQSISVSESSKYSKDHSILKIQTIDENIDIDIEEDSQNSLFEGISNEQINEKKDNNNIKGVPTLAHLCETIFTEHSKTDDPPTLLKPRAKRSNNIGNTTNFLEMEKKELNKAKNNKNSTNFSNQNSSSNTSMFLNTKCPCGESFKTVKACNAHIAKYHPLFLRCGYCTERFNSIIEYNNHRCSVEKGKMFDKLRAELPCPFCQVLLKSKSEYDRHIHFQHFDAELPYQCYECIEKFPSSSGRHVHFTKMHSKCVCNVCGMKLTAGSKLRHEGYHYGLGFPCHICKKSHTNQQNLASHNRVSHEEANRKLVTCNICFKVMETKALSWHLYSHKTITTCELCKKIVCDGRNLEHHIITRHQGKYPWIRCNFCKRKFCNKRLLDRHMKRERCNSYISKISKDNTLLHS